jgi:hypothetical protein
MGNKRKVLIAHDMIKEVQNEIVGFFFFGLLKIIYFSILLLIYQSCIFRET